MNKLLTANFTRVVKNKVFWFGAVSLFLISSGITMQTYFNVRQNLMVLEQYKLDDLYFNFAPMLWLFYIIFISLFIGTEYSDGTIRNKIVVGHVRSNIYVSNLINSIVVSLFYIFIWLISGIAGIPFFGPLQMSLEQVSIYIAICIFYSLAMVSISTFIAMHCTNKATGAILSILLFFCMVIFGSYIYNRLSEPEYYSTFSYTVNGAITNSDPILNPLYLTGFVRSIYEIALKIIPTSQAILVSNLEVADPVFQILSSIAITIIVSFIGIWLFNKKDIK